MARKTYDLAVWQYVGDHKFNTYLPISGRTFYRSRRSPILPGEIVVTRIEPEINAYSTTPDFFGFSIKEILLHKYIENMIYHGVRIDNRAARFNANIKLLSPDRVTFLWNNKEKHINVGETLTKGSLELQGVHKEQAEYSKAIATRVRTINPNAIFGT